MGKKSVGIIGAGPGGLAAGILLKSRGFEVDLFERADRVGGRNARIVKDDFIFDVGPTFFLMPQVLEDLLKDVGESIDEVLPMTQLDPLYDLKFADGSMLRVSADARKMANAIAAFNPGDADRFFSFREKQEQKFQALLPALKRPARGLWDIATLNNVLALPHLGLGSVYDELAKNFEDERVRLAFTFQSKYLGMSPFECPSIFTILPHIEHAYGVWHPRGGCNQISRALARCFEKLGGRLHLSTPVEKVHVKGGQVDSLRVNGDRIPFDYTVMNADFSMGISELVSDEDRRRYKNARVASLKYSCSTFMIYLGLDRVLDQPHHGIHFAQNYRRNIRELVETFELSNDPSFYVHNPSRLDPTLAPKGSSALYVLIPVPNLDGSTDWDAQREELTDRYIDLIEARIGEKIRPHIKVKHVVTPKDWERDYRVYKGATFSLAHSFDQMLQFRPHNEFEDFKNFFLVGGGTHPGSGLPTILESGRIAADLISRRSEDRSTIGRLIGLSRQQKVAHVDAR